MPPVFMGGKIEKLEKVNLSPPRGENPAKKSIDGTPERDAAIFGAKKLVSTNFFGRLQTQHFKTEQK